MEFDAPGYAFVLRTSSSSSSRSSFSMAEAFASTRSCAWVIRPAPSASGLASESDPLLLLLLLVSVGLGGATARLFRLRRGGAAPDATLSALLLPAASSFFVTRRFSTYNHGSLVPWRRRRILRFV